MTTTLVIPGLCVLAALKASFISAPMYWTAPSQRKHRLSTPRGRVAHVPQSLC
jgi:hypothetical protein